MDNIDKIFEQLEKQEATSRRELASAQQKINTLKAENNALEQDAFILLKKLYQSYNEREKIFTRITNNE